MTPQQLKYWLHAPVVAPVFPVLFAQAMRVKRTMPDLPDAPGPNTGEFPGQEPLLRLLGLGESTIAGVGCGSHGEAITGQIAHFLHEKTGRAVHFEAIGRTGIRVQEAVAELVPKLPESPVDLVFIALGGNDTFRFTQPGRWREGFFRLVEAVRQRQPNCGIVVANLPTVWQFTAFTPLMRRVMGRLLRLHAGAIRDLPAHFPRLWYMNYPIDLYKWEKHLTPGQNFADFFADGVHPAPLTCRLWGEEIADFMLAAHAV